MHGLNVEWSYKQNFTVKQTKQPCNLHTNNFHI